MRVATRFLVRSARRMIAVAITAVLLISLGAPQAGKAHSILETPAVVPLPPITNDGHPSVGDLLAPDQGQVHADPQRADLITEGPHPRNVRPITTDSMRIYRNSDGTVNGVTTFGDALFSVDSSTAVTSTDVLGSLMDWIASNKELLGLTHISPEHLPEIRPSQRSPAAFGDLTVYVYDQTYAGHVIIGPQSRLAVTVASDTNTAVSVTGTVADRSQALSGLEDPIGEGHATEAIIEAWQDQGFRGTPRISSLELVAVPSHGQMGYRATVRSAMKAPFVIGGHTATMIVSAVDGELLDLDLQTAAAATDHHPAVVAAYEMADNPDTSSKRVLGPVPGSFYGACPLWLQQTRSPLFPIIVCNARMGDERANVYDFEEDVNDAPHVATAPVLVAGAVAQFPGSFVDPNDGSHQFRTQNHYHKMSAALHYGDGLKSVPGWDHHPNAPFSVFEAAPLTLWTNFDTTSGIFCGSGASGCANSYFYDAPWHDLEHPYAERNFPVTTIAMDSAEEYVLFHEIGHYYDAHSTYGFIGRGLVFDSCVRDTTDEATALVETVADMTMLTLFRQLYPQLPYELDTTENPGTFISLGGGGHLVHSPAVITDDSQLRQFEDDRPSPSSTSRCVAFAGRRMGSVNQAIWKFLWSRRCQMEAPFSCFSTVGAGGGSDRTFQAMIYAESLSNIQSYEQFFENMSMFIWFDSGVVARDFFIGIMRDHGIL